MNCEISLAIPRGRNEIERTSQRWNMPTRRPHLTREKIPLTQWNWHWYWYFLWQSLQYLGDNPGVFSLIRLSPNETGDVHITTRIDFAEAERRIRQLTESQDPAVGYPPREFRQFIHQVQGHQAFLKKCPAIPEDMQGDKLVQAAAKVPTEIALEMIKQVPSVNRVRYRLVPARIKEDDFWQRYFYAIFLIYRDETCWDDWSDIDLNAGGGDSNRGPLPEEDCDNTASPIDLLE